MAHTERMGMLMGMLVRKILSGMLGLTLLCGLAGCTTRAADGSRQSSVTVYGTVDASVDVTR